MKRIKKLLSLVLMIAIALSVFALPASAAVREPAQPNYGITLCPKCEALTLQVYTTKTTGTPTVQYCENYSYPHQHREVITVTNYYCSTCGYTNRTEKTVETCLG